MIDLGVARNMMAADHMKETRVVNNVKRLWLSYTLFAMFAGFLLLPCYHGCCISMVTLLPWLLDFSGYLVTMVVGLQWLPCLPWISTVSLLPLFLVFHGYSVTMVAGIQWLLCCHGCDINWVFSGVETGDTMFKIEQNIEVSTVSVFTRVVTQLTVTHTTDEFNLEYTRVSHWDSEYTNYVEWHNLSHVDNDLQLANINLDIRRWRLQ